MLRVYGRQRFLYASFFLLALGFCANVLGTGECKADPSIALKNKYNEHDFLAACREGNVDVVRYFLDQDDFDANEQFISGVTGIPVHGLFLAAQESRVEVLQSLIDAGADVNQTYKRASPLLVAAQNGDVRVVEILVNTQGVDVNQAQYNDFTPLFLAAQNGHAKIVELLLRAQRIAVNWAQSDGSTALFIAAQNGYPDIVEMLLTGGADYTLKWRFWKFITRSPLDVARRSRPWIRRKKPDEYDRYTRIINVLTQATESVTTSPLSEKTPLLEAFSALRLQNDSK
ncbi:ankyrin repeat domain-containing protein [Sansalvadorimonas verongulae]|uniref:ankyrin repeat domain-containing protein n=1 Tax=Sansalvadorimonas verongulae TaxID=2172824 RepID=UPI0012BC0D13|nr:ankyrin repeat domain-containing protein [Sansalvadorimonas verongulae]MTI12688.1 ankyrin repeat domain-containing protein [Sansalvadorimonas verongulae]